MSIWIAALAFAAVSLAQAQTFITAPFAADSSGERGSPRVNLSAQTASIVFEASVGYFYRVIVDTHGAGGVGGPDGAFVSGDDWTWEGGEGEDVHFIQQQLNGALSRTIRINWDGSDRWGSGSAAPDGVYTAQVELSLLAATLRAGNASKGRAQIEIDTEPAGLSFRADTFSPNGDGLLDSSVLRYASTEELEALSLTIAEGPFLGRPSAAFSKPFGLSGTTVWNGRDLADWELPDGSYTLQLTAVDWAGNVSTAQRTIMIDTESPSLGSLSPVNGALLSAPVAQVEALADAQGGSPIDLDSISVTVTNAGGDSLSGELLADQSGAIRFVLETPLSSLAQNGVYNVSVSAADEAGNSASRSGRFRLDTAAPLIGQAFGMRGPVVPGFIGLGTDALFASVLETGSGLDFSSAQAVLTAPSGGAFPIWVSFTETGSGGRIEASYAGLQEEGGYTLSLSGVRDLAGNEASPRSFAFLYDETAPRIASLTPFDRRPGAHVRINVLFDSVEMTVSDAASGIDFAASSVAVIGPDGSALTGAVHNDGESTLTFQLSSALSLLGADDGTYSVRAVAADRAGNRTQVESALTLDTQAPRAASMVPAANSVIRGGLDSILLNVTEETTGLNVTALSAQLISPSGEPIAASLRYVSENALRLEFAPLVDDGTDDGVYRAVWTLSDLAGNESVESFEFELSNQEPETYEPYAVATDPADRAAVSRWTQFTAQIADDSELGIDFDGVTVSVLGPNGFPVSGWISNDGVGSVTFTAAEAHPTDGSADGVYTARTRAENMDGGVLELETTFLLDTLAPSIVSVIPAHRSVLVAPISLSGSIEALDAGSGLDIDGSTIAVIAPDGSSVPVSALYNGAGLISFSTGELTAAGEYWIEMTLRDLAGNEGALSRSLFEIPEEPEPAEPTVTSIMPAHRSYAHSLSYVSALLSGAGDDSTIEAIGPNGQPVAGTTTFSDGEIRLTFEAPTAADGRDDGEYLLRVTPINEVDEVEVAGPTREYTFILDTQAPRISGLSPSELFSGSGYVSEPFSTLTATFTDAVSGLDLSASSFRVADGSGADAPGVLTDDGSGSFVWTSEGVPSDGVYTVTAVAADRAGHTSSYERSFALDTEAPAIVSSSMAFNAMLTAAVDQIALELSDGSGIGLDLASSQVSLSGPEGSVPLQKAFSDGVLTLAFPSLDSDGGYTLSVLLLDGLGNAMSEAALYPFTLDTEAPRISGLSPSELFSGSGYVSEPFSTLTATFADAVSGLDLSASSFRVVDGSGADAPGVLTDDGSGSFVWTSEGVPSDGVYTVTAVAADRAGHTASYERSFALDTEAPAIVSSSIAFNAMLTAAVDEIALELSDGSGIGLDLASSQVSLSGPEGSVPLQKAFSDGVLTLAFPSLDSDGSYTLSVLLLDGLGNAMSEAALYPFTLDTEAPRISGLSPSELFSGSGYVSEPFSTLTATFADAVSGLDLSASSFRVADGSGADAPGVLTDDGSGTFMWTSEGVPSDGVYTVTAVAADRAGHTSSYERSFALDTEAPAIVSSSIAFNAMLTAAVDEIALELSDGSGIGLDLASSQVSLSGPEGSVPLQKSFTDGVLTLAFPSLDSDGGYTLSVLLLDGLGNAMSEAALYPFTLDTEAPRISGLSPSELFSGSGYVSEPFSTLTATFTDAVSGLDLSASSFRVVDGSGADAPGVLTDDGSGTFVWTSEGVPSDGVYTVTAVAADRAGHTASYERSFALDTEAPAIVSSSIAFNAMLTAAVDQIALELSDGSGIGLDLASSQVSLSGPEGSVPLQKSFTDGVLTLAFPSLDSDGGYTLSVLLLDGLGNAMSEAALYPFTLDTEAPRISGLSPSELFSGSGYVSEPFSTLTATFADAVSGLDLSASSFRVVDGSGADAPGVLTDDGSGTFVWTSEGVPSDGVYTVTAVAADRAGHTASYERSFALDTEAPAIVSSSIAFNAMLTAAVDQIALELSDGSGIGLDLASSQVSLSGPEGSVPLQKAFSDGVLTLAFPELDADGSYTLSVLLLDGLGNAMSEAALYPFTLDTEAPRVQSSSPIDVSFSVSYVSDSLSYFEASLTDEGPSGLEMESASIRLLGPGGAEVAGESSHNGVDTVRLQLSSPLATNGSDDGVYTLMVEASDRAGNSLSVSSSAVYDTQAPELVGSAPADGSEIDPSARAISIEARDSLSGVDPSGVAASLTAPSGERVFGSVGVSVGGDVSTIAFAYEEALTEIGAYRFTAELADRAGNARSIALSFYNPPNTPTVISTTPDTRLPETAYAPIGLDEVTVQLREVPGSGISTAPGASMLRLIDPQGNAVSGMQSSRGGDTLVFTLGRELRSDGSDDGAYQIEVTPANAAGIQGPTQVFSFVYDSQPPEILSSIGTFFPQSEFEQSGDAIAGFYAELLDATSGVDWENVDETWMTLENPQGELVEGSVTGSSLFGLLQLVFTTPLASDGSEDGEYTLQIQAVDLAGNASQIAFRFLVDLTAPSIDATTLEINGAPIVIDTNEADYPTSVNSESGAVISVSVSDDNAGVDLARSGIVVTGPDGSPLSGTLRQNNEDLLVFESGPLPREGLYQVSVTAVGVDLSGLGVQPQSVLGGSFLFEKTAPTAAVTSGNGNGGAVFESEPAHIAGTAADVPQEGEFGVVPASGVALVEIGGTGPDGEALEWEAASDDSVDALNPWTQWSADFLPSRSGTYRVLARVTDRAGNSSVVDAGTYEFTTALAFKGPVYVWPNPLSRGRGDTAHFSFETNQADQAEWRLSVYTVSGVLVYRASGAAQRERQANSQSATWNLRNDGGMSVASGIYVFKLEIDDGQSVYRKMGRMLVVK